MVGLFCRRPREKKDHCFQQRPSSAREREGRCLMHSCLGRVLRFSSLGRGGGGSSLRGPFWSASSLSDSLEGHSDRRFRGLNMICLQGLSSDCVEPQCGFFSPCRIRGLSDGLLGLSGYLKRLLSDCTFRAYLTAFRAFLAICNAFFLIVPSGPLRLHSGPFWESSGPF